MLRLLRRNIFVRLAVSLAFVLILSFGIAISVSVRVGRGKLEKTAAEALQTSAGVVLSGVHLFLEERQRNVRLWSGLEAMEDILIQDRNLRIENLLLQLQREEPGAFSELLVLTSDGTVVASTTLDRVGQRLDLATLGLGADDGTGSRWGGPRMSDAHTRVVTLAHPVTTRLRRGTLGWFVAMVNWQVVEAMVRQGTVQGQRQDNDRFLLLVDRSGHLLAWNRRILAGIPEATAAIARPGSRGVVPETLGTVGVYLVARVTAPEPGSGPGATWSVVAFRNTREADAVVDIFVKSVVVSALFGLLLAAGLSFVVARGSTGPIARLTVAERTSEIELTTDQLRETLQTAEAATGARSELPANVSHETVHRTDAANFNRNDLLDRIGGDEALMNKLFATFLKNCPEWMKAIQAAVTAGDARALERSAHTLKGTLASLSAGSATARASELEEIGRSGDLSRAGSVSNSLAEAVEKLQTMMTGLRQKGAA